MVNSLNNLNWDYEKQESERSNHSYQQFKHRIGSASLYLDSSGRSCRDINNPFGIYLKHIPGLSKELGPQYAIDCSVVHETIIICKRSPNEQLKSSDAVQP